VPHGIDHEPRGQLRFPEAQQRSVRKNVDALQARLLEQEPPERHKALLGVLDQLGGRNPQVKDVVNEDLDAVVEAATALVTKVGVRIVIKVFSVCGPF
jgi:hypothetical protein